MFIIWIQLSCKYIQSELYIIIECCTILRDQIKNAPWRCQRKKRVDRLKKKRGREGATLLSFFICICSSKYHLVLSYIIKYFKVLLLHFIERVFMHLMFHKQLGELYVIELDLYISMMSLLKWFRSCEQVSWMHTPLIHSYTYNCSAFVACLSLLLLLT